MHAKSKYIRVGDKREKYPDPDGHPLYKRPSSALIDQSVFTYDVENPNFTDKIRNLLLAFMSRTISEEQKGCSRGARGINDHHLKKVKQMEKCSHGIDWLKNTYDIVPQTSAKNVQNV